MAPIRNDTTNISNNLNYNTTTSEITYAPAPATTVSVNNATGNLVISSGLKTFNVSYNPKIFNPSTSFTSLNKFYTHLELAPSTVSQLLLAPSVFDNTPIINMGISMDNKRVVFCTRKGVYYMSNNDGIWSVPTLFYTYTDAVDFFADPPLYSGVCINAAGNIVMITTNDKLIIIYKWETTMSEQKRVILTWTARGIKMTPDASLVVLSGDFEGGELGCFRYNSVSNACSTYTRLDTPPRCFNASPNASGTKIYYTDRNYGIYMLTLNPITFTYDKKGFSTEATNRYYTGAVVNSDASLVILNGNNGQKCAYGLNLDTYNANTDSSSGCISPINILSSSKYQTITISYDNKTLYQCTTDTDALSKNSYIYSTNIDYIGGFQIN